MQKDKPQVNKVNKNSLQYEECSGNNYLCGSNVYYCV